MKRKKKQNIPILKIDDAIQTQQIAKLTELKNRRDNEKVNALLAELKEKAQTDENLMPHVISCVEHLCSLGEISHALRDVWGEYKG